MVSHVVSESTSIAAPPEVVFAILADPRQHPRIDGSGSVRAVVSGPPRLHRGAEFGADMRLLGVPYRIRNRVVEFEEDRLIAWRHFGGHRWRYRLEPEGAGTRVTESFDYSRFNRVRRLVIEAAQFPRRNRRGIQETLVLLRAAAESDAAQSGAAQSGAAESDAAKSGDHEEKERRVSLRKGSRVSWSWGNGTATGKIVEVHREKVTRTIKGSAITRNGSTDDPAYLIEQEDGARVLKSKSEVEKA